MQQCDQVQFEGTLLRFVDCDLSVGLSRQNPEAVSLSK